MEGAQPVVDGRVRAEVARRLEGDGELVLGHVGLLRRRLAVLGRPGVLWEEDVDDLVRRDGELAVA